VADELRQGSLNSSYIALVASLSRSWPSKGWLASARDTHSGVGNRKLHWKQASPQQQHLCFHSHQLRVLRTQGFVPSHQLTGWVCWCLIGVFITQLSFTPCFLRQHPHLQGAAGTAICVTHTTSLFRCPRICSGPLQLALSQAKSKHSSGGGSGQGPLPVRKSAVGKTSSPLVSSTR